MAGLQEDNKSLKQSLSKVETERKQAQERSNNLEKVGMTSHSCSGAAYSNVLLWTILVLFVAPNSFAASSSRSIGEKQFGNRPELQAEDPAAATGAGADRAPGDAGTAHRQIRVY